MMHIASCSFGKDSIATILLALENNEPLDRVVFCEVMFDHSRNISGEIPEHIEWIYSTAIPKLESMGVKVDVVKSERDYLYHFFHVRTAKSKYEGKLSGFPMAGRCIINSDCKVKPIKRYYKQFTEDVIQYVGIAIDEPKRLARIKGNKISLLAKYGYTEAMARAKCEQYGLLSPIYQISARNGCWFCPSATIRQFCELRKRHPNLWEELRQLAKVSNLNSYGFTYKGLTLPEVEARMNFEDRQMKLF